MICGGMLSAVNLLGRLCLASAIVVASLGEAKFGRADVFGPTDDRVEVNPELRPFVAAISYYDDTTRTLHRANGWQALHPQLLATAAHVLAQDGVFLVNKKTTEPTLTEISSYDVKIAGCPTDRYWITDILTIGTLDSIGDPARDFAVVLLNRPTCLSARQLGVPINIFDALAPAMIEADNDSLIARLDAFMPRMEVAQSFPITSFTSLETRALQEIALFESYGLIENYFYRPVGDKFLVSTAVLGNARSWSKALSWHGDATEGSSGGPVSVSAKINTNGDIRFVNRVIGMQVQKIKTPGIERNIISPYAGMFQRALENAAKSMPVLP